VLQFVSGWASDDGMSLWRRALISIPVVIAVGTALAAGIFYAIGPDRVWAQFGAADLGDVDFASLKRRDTPNDALACRPEFCAAMHEVEAPASTLPPDELYRIVQNAVSAEPRLEKVGGDPAQGTLRYVQRSRVMRFPDTINVKVTALPAGGSTVLLYSRSLLGKGDMGVNRARILRWIGLIEAAAQK
jgi:uncharacterized protein (DUF1499 family)